jgi:hypothetical protein
VIGSVCHVFLVRFLSTPERIYAQIELFQCLRSTNRIYAVGISGATPILCPNRAFPMPEVEEQDLHRWRSAAPPPGPAHLPINLSLNVVKSRILGKTTSFSRYRKKEYEKRGPSMWMIHSLFCVRSAHRCAAEATIVRLLQLN